MQDGYETAADDSVATAGARTISSMIQPGGR
jgi:hypothetical protein